jgi:hypothetical protein
MVDDARDVPALAGTCGRRAAGTVTSRCPDTALAAFLSEHLLCRPGLDDPDVTHMLVAMWCECGARIAVKLRARA